MKELDVSIVGDVAWNLDITPKGSKISPGGAAYYSAIGASYFSDRVGIVARVGHDFDTSLLTNKGIDTEGLRIITDGLTCKFVVTQYENDTRDFSSERGVANVVNTDIYPESFKNATFIHLPTQLPEHALAWLDVLVQHKNVSVDTFEQFVKNYPELTKQMLLRASFIFINETEINMLRNLGDLSFNVPVILKKGSNGATYLNGNDSFSITAPNVSVVDTTGAGDVLAGAFLAQRAKGISIETSLEKAVQLASASVTAFGVEHIINKKGLK